MNSNLKIVVFACDRSRLDGAELPPNVRQIPLPCTGRISPLFVLNAIQGGVDGILVSGCVPEKCHFKEGNLGARRQLDEFRRFLGYVGMESERIRFAWIDVTERGRIQREIASLEEVLRSLGQLERLVTRSPLAVQGEAA